MTKQVMTISDNGRHFVCTKEDGVTNPYRLYQKWFDIGWHRKQIARYADFQSVMWYLIQNNIHAE